MPTSTPAGERRGVRLNAGQRRAGIGGGGGGQRRLDILPVPSPAPCWIARIALRDMRNHAQAEFKLQPGLVVVTGDNGTGKTNLLEALSLLAPGRGLRGASYGEMARLGGPGGWSVAATLDTAGGEVAIGTGTTPAAPERRLVRVNGGAAPLSALGEWLSLLWLTPAMDRLFADTASGRRRFLDRLVLALLPGHGGEVTRYDAAMRARNRLLASDGSPDPLWLAGLERAMATHGIAVARARQATVTALAAALDAAPPGPFARAAIAVDGWQPGTGVGPGDAEAVFADALAQCRSADTASGRAGAGPHRSDLAVTHAGKGVAAALSSTGEQKALLIGIVLAHAGLVAARTGRQPLLLFDEVAAHLDAHRRGALFERLLDTGAQAWLTGTDAVLFDGLGATATRLNLAQPWLRG